MKYHKPTGDQPIEVYTFIHRRHLVRLICSAVLCLGFALGGCDLRKVDASAETNTKKEGIMETTQTSTTIQYEIPPIDAAVSSATETATFALG